MKRFLRYKMSVFLILLIVLPAYAEQSSTKKLLVIHSYNSGASVTDSIMNGIMNTLRQEGSDIQISAEYLDVHSRSTAVINRTRSFIISKIKGTKPDVVIVSDNEAFDFILEFRNSLFPGAQVVFCCLKGFHSDMISGFHDVTGVIQEPSIADTVYLALRLHPETERIVMIGTMIVPAGRINKHGYTAQLPAIPAGIQVEFWGDLDQSGLKDRLRYLEKNSLIFMNGIISNDARNQILFGEAMKSVSKDSRVPIYSLFDAYFGYGIVGGRLISNYRQGELAAKMAIRILKGESAGNIPIVEPQEANKYMFDYRQLVKFSIPLSKLPPNSEIIYQPDSFYFRHKGIVWTIAIALCILIGLVIFLAVAVMRQRKAEKSLLQAYQMLVNSPVVFFRRNAGKGWPTEFATTNITQFGYTQEEFISGVKQWYSIVHADDLDRIVSEMEDNCSSGKDLFKQEYRIWTKNGDIRWVEDYVIAERNDGGRIEYYQGALIDVTERKLAEEALLNKTDELNRIFNLSLDLLSVSDMDTHFLKLNPAWAQTLGYRLDELEGKSFLDFLHPDDVPATLNVTSVMRDGKDVIDFLNRYRCSDGTYRWIEWRSTPFRNNLIYAASRDVTERKRMEDALQESEKRLSEIIDFLPDATFAVDGERRIIAWNRALEDMTGFRSEDMIGKGNYEYAIPLYGVRRPVLIDLAFRRDKETEGRYDHIISEGESFVVEMSMSLCGKTRILRGNVSRLSDSKGNISGAIETLRDITEQRQAEEEQAKLREQLFQSQKMETIGLLAGGVAHDFNNLLTPILGYSEMMLLELPEGNPLRADVEHIRQAAELARGLTRRLLTFSRKQILELRVVDVGFLICDFEHVLRRTIRENIEINITIAKPLGLVKADVSQIEEALLNLVINGQDAMPEGGLLSIEAKNIELDETCKFFHTEIKSGAYVMLSVSDTGMGMDEKALTHVFEPFFTTKELGRGTGLGLATVYGIVKQHGGYISVSSEKDHGSIFNIFLPEAAEEDKVIDNDLSLPDRIERGKETILVVEDNDSVRAFVRGMLESLGYQVIVTGDVDTCIEIAMNYPEKIDLLLTDVIMPRKNGKELYELLKKSRPDLKVLFMSGYTGNVIGNHGILEEGVNFLQKPFTIMALSQKVRYAIEPISSLVTNSEK